MDRLEYCPLVGSGGCNKPYRDIIIRKNAFFLAEPFKPESDRRNRELAIRSAIKESLKENYSESLLNYADKEPTEAAIFCDICQKIQSSEYGIVDLTDLNANVLLEFGMLLALGRPIFVIMKKAAEEQVRSKLPSNIDWKRAITYQETIEIMSQLVPQLNNRSHLKVKQFDDDINLIKPLEANYPSIKKWYNKIGRRGNPKKATAQKKAFDAIISRYSQFLKMNPDQIIDDATQEATAFAGVVTSHDDHLKDFLSAQNTPSKAFYYWGVLRGFYKHNNIRLNFPRPNYAPAQIYEKLTTEQLRRMCNVGTLRSRSWILVNSYLGLPIGSIMYLKLEDFNINNWSETRKIYPVNIREEVSGTFSHTAFIGLDAKLVLDDYLKKNLIMKNQDLVWDVHNHQNLVTEFENARKKAGVGISADTHVNRQEEGLPRNFSSITSKAIAIRLKDALEEVIPPSNWNLVDHILGRIREGVKISTQPSFEELEKAYLTALPKLTVYDGIIPPITSPSKIIPKIYQSFQQKTF